MSRSGRDFAKHLDRGTPDQPVVWRGSTLRLLYWSWALSLVLPVMVLAAGGAFKAPVVGLVAALVWLVVFTWRCHRCAVVDHGTRVEVRNAFSTFTVERPLSVGRARWHWAPRFNHVDGVRDATGRMRPVWAVMAVRDDERQALLRMLEHRG